jgi:dienelactone hydrolase
MKKAAFLFIACLLFAGCDAPNALSLEPSPPAIESTTPSKQGLIASPAITATEPAIPVGSLEPVALTFPSMDGEMLSGTYYPPAKSNAPVVVLMHQYDMNQHEWDAIALWLQNAPQKTPAQNPVPSSPWLDASWFPTLPADFSVGVLTFTFRTCDNGCGKHLPAEWLLDAEAAMGQAASMPGVDLTSIVPIGTSIGADAAVDACNLTAPRSSLRCAGAMSLSPGSYLNMEYQKTVQELVDLGVPVLCFASEDDAPSAAACQSVKAEGFTASVDPGLAHGIRMVDPKQKTNVLLEIYDFLSGLQ